MLNSDNHIINAVICYPIFLYDCRINNTFFKLMKVNAYGYIYIFEEIMINKNRVFFQPKYGDHKFVSNLILKKNTCSFFFWLFSFYLVKFAYLLNCLNVCHILE